MEATENIGSDRDSTLSREDPIQRRPISGQFLFGAISRPGLSDHKRAQAVRRDSDALDPIRRFGALDDGLFPQYIQDFRFLPDPEVLLSTCFHARAEKPASSNRDRQAGQFMRIECQHRLTVA
jgi:hypothetical protein